MQRFAVIGLGRFGSQLARALARAGAEVIAIDRNRRLVEEIADEVAVAVQLDSTDEDALRAQDVDKVDAAVVGIGQDFEANILTTVVLKAIGIKYILARAERKTHGQILKRIGAHEVIFPEEESALRWAFKLRAPQLSEKMEFAPGYSLVQYHAPASFNGRDLLTLDLRRKHRVNLIAIRPAADAADPKASRQVINVPQPDTIIRRGDLLWLVGADEDLAALPSE